MGLTKQLAKHLRDVHFGGNWTTSNLKNHLSDVSWAQANTKIYNLNTIAILAYHIHYYIHVVTKVLQGGVLDAKDEYSFNIPSINSETEWQEFLTICFTEAEQFATLIEKLPDDILLDDFTDPKYGNYFRNLLGIIEHTHYHLGQIVVIKKIINQKTEINLNKNSSFFTF